MRMPKNRLMLNNRVNAASSKFSSRTRLPRPMPALEQSRSSRPSIANATSMSCAGASGTARSVTMLPIAPTSLLLVASRSALMSVTITRAPRATNATASALPIPDAPPVTRAVVP